MAKHLFRTPRARLLYDSERKKLGLDNPGQEYTNLEGMTNNLLSALMAADSTLDSDMREVLMLLNIDANEHLQSLMPQGIDTDLANRQTKLDNAKSTGNLAYIEQEQRIFDSLTNAKHIENGNRDKVVPFKNEVYERKVTRETAQTEKSAQRKATLGF